MMHFRYGISCRLNKPYADDYALLIAGVYTAATVNHAMPVTLWYYYFTLRLALILLRHDDEF